MKYFFLLFLVSFSAAAQVGIGTSSPEADLHVAGDSATIRIEGLNHLNDPLNIAGADNRVKAFINQEGDLTLQNSADNTNSLHFIVDNSDNLSNLRILEHSGDSIPQAFNIYSQNLILESNAYVEIKYNFSYGVYQTYSQENPGAATIVNDGEARVIKTYFTIDGDTEQYGQISQIYFNNSINGGTGFFYNNGNGYVFLAQGPHTITFHAEILGASDTVIVVGGSEDSLKIRLYQ